MENHETIVPFQALRAVGHDVCVMYVPPQGPDAPYPAVVVHDSRERVPLVPAPDSPLEAEAIGLAGPLAAPEVEAVVAGKRLVVRRGRAARRRVVRVAGQVDTEPALLSVLDLRAGPPAAALVPCDTAHQADEDGAQALLAVDDERVVPAVVGLLVVALEASLVHLVEDGTVAGDDVAVEVVGDALALREPYLPCDDEADRVVPYQRVEQLLISAGDQANSRWRPGR